MLLLTNLVCIMQAEALFTPEEYLDFEAEAEVKHEYWYGRIIAMAGETPNHSTVKDNLVNALRHQRPACIARSAGVRVRAPGYGRENYAYPDGLMVCGEERYDTSANPPTLLNPALLIEITSDSTRSRDTIDKLDAYFQLDSLQEYWIVEPDRPFVVRYVRSEGTIVVHFIRDFDQTVTSDTLDLTIPMETLYHRVAL